MDVVLPMNTGAEAVETAIKVARKWGYDGQGRARRPGGDHRVRRATSTAGRPRSSASPTDPDVADGFGPFTPGFRIVPYGDLDALRGAAITPSTCRRARRADPGRGRRHRPAARLPAPGSASSAPRTACSDRRRDPVRPRPHRARSSPAQHEGVGPDVYLLGKALGGGIVPVSAIVADADGPGRASPRAATARTFGGNPLACAVAREVVAMLQHRRVPGAGQRARRADARQAERAAVLGGEHGARPRPVGRARVRVAARRARYASGSPPAGCWPRRPTAT